MHAAALELLDLSERYYATAYIGMSCLPGRSAWAIGAARRVYHAIGSKLRAGGPATWEKHVSTTKAEKIGLLAAVLGDVGVTRVVKPDTPRSGSWQRP